MVESGSLSLFAAGFEKRQAELIVSALVTLTTANMDVVYKDMVTTAHQVGHVLHVRTELKDKRNRTPLCMWLLGNRGAADHGSPGLHQEGHGDPGEERVRQPSI